MIHAKEKPNAMVTKSYFFEKLLKKKRKFTQCNGTAILKVLASCFIHLFYSQPVLQAFHRKLLQERVAGFYCTWNSTYKSGECCSSSQVTWSSKFVGISLYGSSTTGIDTEEFKPAWLQYSSRSWVING